MTTPRRLKGYRVRLDPTPAQREALGQHAGAARWAYNYALRAKLNAIRTRQAAIDELVTLRWTDQQARDAVETRVPNYVGVAALWRGERDVHPDPRRGSPWWPTVSSYAFSSGFRAADSAFKNWAESTSGRRAGRAVGRPRFKRKGRGSDAFTLYHDVKRPTIRVEGTRHLQVPRIGRVRTWDKLRRLDRIIGRGGVVKSVTISRGASYWYAAVLVDEPVTDPRATSDPAGDLVVRASARQQRAGIVGVDAGVAALVATSADIDGPHDSGLVIRDGRLVANPQWTGRDASRLAKALRELARKQGARRGETPSNRYRKAAARVARLQHMIRLRRRSHLHQLTKVLATEFAVVAIEGLRIGSMTRSARGTLEAPGRNVAAKSGLNRVILDAAWGEMRRQLEYKTAWYGSRLIVVPAHHTSQTCAACGHTAAESRESQARFRCVSCGHRAHADINAAINIATRAVAVPPASAGGRKSRPVDEPAGPPPSAASTGRPGRSGKTTPSGHQTDANRSRSAA